jgi:hypothetical protein
MKPMFWNSYAFDDNATRDDRIINEEQAAGLLAISNPGERERESITFTEREREREREREIERVMHARCGIVQAPSSGSLRDLCVTPCR